MFPTGASPYSPFFTSGLLSQYDNDEPIFLGPRRGSLPTDSLSPTTEDSSSAFYFTLQPKRDTCEYRSFLSLDLAESYSLRSASLKRKAPGATRVSSTLLRNDKVITFPRIPETTLTPPHTSLRLRHSRDSMRTIPSPKPAPCTTLPDVPVPSSSRTPTSSAPPRLPSIVISTCLGLTMDLPAPAPSAVATTAVPLTYRNSTATVSTTVRRVNRSHALARLEGRTRSTRRMPKKRNFNFMSMSDDEGDDEPDVDAVLNEPEDHVLPPLKSAPIGGRFPSSAISMSPRKRTKEWFPLKSFIDLQSGEDDLNRWGWRSFIEVASVS
ncbi:hypothetical protein DXG01_012331 [Tephrocybe rancida]|nr:hypothetical protein DXG01_012331 [Tephrocybe rancida]